MPVAKVLARGWTVAIDTGSGSPVWTAVKGINTFSFGNSKNDADTTDFDSAGNAEHMPASRGRTFSAEGFYLEDPVSKARDAGQAAIETAGNLVGPAGIKSFKVTSPAGITRTFSGSVNVGDLGGGNDDPTSWGFEITVSGAVVVA